MHTHAHTQAATAFALDPTQRFGLNESAQTLLAEGPVSPDSECDPSPLPPVGVKRRVWGCGNVCVFVLGGSCAFLRMLGGCGCVGVCISQKRLCVDARSSVQSQTSVVC